MAAPDLRELMRDTTPTLRRALQEAAELGLARGRSEVSVGLLFLALLERPTSDFSHVLAHYGVNRGDLARQLGRSVEAAPRNATGLSHPNAALVALIDAARQRLDSTTSLRSGMTLLAFLESPRRLGAADGLWPALARILPEALWSDFAAATAGSAEQGEAQAAAPPATGSEAKALTRFTVDLTAEARAGRIDPIHGRHAELQQIVNVLGRRRQNNPILVGEAGVGKTAMVEAFALKVAAGEVPPALRKVAVLTLDLGLLQAGAAARGDFEARLKGLIEAVEAAPVPAILFIDEAHSLVGAGGTPGQGDAATLLKPALARGSLRMIAATTWAEYKRHFERDAALARRFQLVKIDEPDGPAATAMLQALVGRLARHHDVAVLSEAVDAAVALSQRHVSDRRLPDKAVGILDAACSRVALARVAPPASVESRGQQRDALRQSLAAMEADARLRGHADSRRDALAAALVAAETGYDDARRRWQDEKARVAAIAEARIQGRTEDVHQLEAQLIALQAGNPQVPLAVDRRAVAAVVADLSGLPLAALLSEEAELLAGLGERLSQAVIGQDDAMAAIARHIRTNRAELGSARRPAAALLLAGPESVGKRRCAEALADILFGGRKGVLALNMNEYQEAFSLSALRGAPRGYVGWGEGGLLTEAVRRNPHRVLLFENVERAHPSVQTLLSQILEAGTIEDADGLTVDFRNAPVVMTITEDGTGDRDAIRRRLNARLGGLAERAEVVPFRPLTATSLRMLAARRLEDVGARVRASHAVALTWQDDIPDRLAAAALPGSARRLEEIVEGALLSPLSALLPRLSPGDCVHVGSDGQVVTLAAAGAVERVELEPPPPPPPPPPPSPSPPPLRSSAPTPLPPADATRLWTKWR